MWQQASKDTEGPAAQGPSTQGADPGRATRSDQLASPGGAAFVEFDKAGNWSGEQVLAALSAQTTVPDELRAAILAGPVATARYCVALRDRISASTDPAQKLETAQKVGALTSRINELVHATSRSPLQYGQLADVARWGAQLPASGAAAPPTAAPPAPGAADPGNAAAESYATTLASGPGARITSGGKDQIRGIDFKNTTNDEHRGEDSGNPALAGWRFLRDPFDNTVTAVRPDGTGLQFTFQVESQGEASHATLTHTEPLSKLRVGALKRQDQIAPLEKQESEAGRKARIKQDDDNFAAALAKYKETPAQKAAAEAYEQALADYATQKPPKGPPPKAPAGYPSHNKTTACPETPSTVYHAAGGDQRDSFPFTPPTTWPTFRKLDGNPQGPKPGDVYWLWDVALNRAAHMGVFKSSSPVAGAPDLQTWVVTDGGQGGYDKIQLAEERTRGPFNPRTGVFSSSIAEAGQNKGDRKLVGWVDIEAFFAERAAAGKK